MAKSLRSKRRRAVLQVKRKKYAKKELERLKELVKKRDDREQALNNLKNELVIKMETEPGSGKKIKNLKPKLTSEYNPITLRNKHGAMPKWMNHRVRKRFFQAKREKKL